MTRPFAFTTVLALSLAYTLGQAQDHATRDTAATAAHDTASVPVVTAPADAQTQTTAEGPAAASQSDVDGVRSQVLVLDEYLGRTLDRTVARSARPLTLQGTIQSRYFYVPEKKDTNTFAIPLASLNFRGILYKDYREAHDLTYGFGLSSTGLNSPTLTDAFLAYTFFSTVDLGSNYLNLSIGQQKKNFGLEAQSTDEQSPSVFGSSYLTGPFADLNQRDIGFVLRGDLFPTVDYGYNYRSPLIQYSVGVFNGNGPNSVDNTKDKEFVLRTQISPPVGYYSIFRGISFGASYAQTNKAFILSAEKVKAKTVRIVAVGGKDTINYVATPARTLSDTLSAARRTRLGGDISYIRTPVNLTIEGVYGTQDSAAYSTTDSLFHPAHRRNAGGSITLFINVGEQFLRQYREQSRQDDWWPVTWQPFFRLDGFDPDVSEKVVGDWQLVATGGINLFFARTTKFQANYRWRKTENQPAKNHEYVAQFQFGF